MNENNKVSELISDSNNIGTPGFSAMLKELAIFIGSYLDISEQEELNQEAEIILEDFCTDLK